MFAGLENKSIDGKFDLVKHSVGAKQLMKEYKVQKDCDDDLENLVDWKLPMIPQIPKLGSNYNKWINQPVDRKLILYGNPFLEMLRSLVFPAVLIFSSYLDYILQRCQCCKLILIRFNRSINDNFLLF